MAITDPVEEQEFVPSLAPITEAKQYTAPDIGPDPGVLAGAGDVINAPAPDTQVGAKTTALATELGTGEKSRYISPEATVQGQLDTILSREEKPEYIRVSEAKAAEEANRAGMLSTSMAIGAARKGVIETALQVAQPDAATYKESDLATQRQIAESVLTGQRAEEERATSRQQFGQQYALDRNRAQDNLKALATKGEIDFGAQKLGEAAEDRRFEFRMKIDADIENARISQNERESVRNSVTELDLRHSADLTNILTNPNLDDAGRRAAVARVDAQHTEDVQWTVDSAGMDYTWGGQPTSNSVAPEINNGPVDPVTGVTTTVDPATNLPITTLSGTPVDYSALPEGYVSPISTSGGGTIEDRQAGLVSTGFDAVTGEETFLEPMTDMQLAEKSLSQDLAQGTPYAELAGLSFTDFNDFQSNLANTGVYGTDEYFNFTNRPELGTPDQLKESYDKVMYAALNPENESAQTEALDAITAPVPVIAGTPGSYSTGTVFGGKTHYIDYPNDAFKVDPATLPPTQRGMTAAQQWLNDNVPATPAPYVPDQGIDLWGGGSGPSDGDGGGEG